MEFSQWGKKSRKKVGKQEIGISNLYTVKSLMSEAIPSATQLFMRAYKISHFPGL